MIGHTSAPWRINTDPQLSGYAVCADSRGCGWSSSVATCNQRDGRNPLTHEEAMANARLISAAPTLLEALATLRGVCLAIDAKLTDYRPNDREYAAAMQGAADAIALATGSP